MFSAFPISKMRSKMGNVEDWELWHVKFKEPKLVWKNSICYLDFFWIQNWWPLKSANPIVVGQPSSAKRQNKNTKVLWRDKVRASFILVSFYLPLSLTNLKFIFNQVAEQQHMPGDCGWLGSLSTFFQQIIYQAAVTQLFRHFNGRDRLLKCGF